MDQPTRLTEKQKLDIRDKVLDDFEKKLGLPKNAPPGNEEELQEYLSMDRTVLESTSPENLRFIAVRLAQFNIYIQRAINRCRAILTWSDAELYKITAQELSQFNGDTYLPKETKMALVVRKSLAARELQDINLYAKQTIDRMTDLANGVKNLSYVIGLAAGNRKNE